MEINEYSSSRFERIYDEEDDLHKSLAPLEFSNITLDISTPPIPKLKYPHIHYRCPKCYKFPLIEFVDKKFVKYLCPCRKENKEEKQKYLLLEIEKLFIKENKYMTFFNDESLSRPSHIEKKDEIIGFKCTNHKSEKFNKFRFYCLSCYKNICKECCQSHLDQRHDLIVFDFYNIDVYKKLKEIDNYLYSLNKKEIEEQSSELSKSKIEDFMNDDKDNKKIIKVFDNDEKMEIEDTDYFIELINIIIRDYLSYPNYFHFFNILNIYRFFTKEEHLKKKTRKDTEKYIKKDNDNIRLIFHYDQYQTSLNSNTEETIKYVFRAFLEKVIPDYKKKKFYYNGKLINEELKVGDIISETDKERGKMDIVIKKSDKIEDLIDFKEVICPNCGDNIVMNIKDYKINLHDCINKHKINNILFSEFANKQKVDLSKIICNQCNKINKSNTFKNEFYKCFSCGKNICPNCKFYHDKSHMIINYDQKNYFCEKHNKNYNLYCNQCKKNICTLCENEHNNHDKINFEKLLPNTENILKEMNEFKKKIDQFNENIKEIINQLNNIVLNIEIYFKITNDIINNYKNERNNYQNLKNINEFISINKSIIEDINKIINEKSLKQKMNYIMDIHFKMNNINDNEIELKKDIKDKVTKEPKNLKYKLDIINTNDFYGYNDLFEVFLSNKDNNKYIVSKNIYNYDLDIFTLLNNKKILSLSGHKNHITAIKYFLNNKDNNEYLISSDINGIVIIWDITNNYNILYKFDTNSRVNSEENNSIYSSLLIFPKNHINNYIVISTNNIANDKSTTRVYSLNNGNFIKYILISQYIEIKQLLSWFNKKTNKYYIIELAYKSIIINNLLEEEIYSILIQEPEGHNLSGFIFNKNDNDYLCSSSHNGYINIWDLINNNLFKTINTNQCFLINIINWNDKYIIAIDYYNNAYKIIDLEEGKVITDVREQQIKQVKCVKKLSHPLYDESLLSVGTDQTIKLWVM